ncbi:MAG: V-type ATP synthase subunit D [Clostridiales bacterium]|nr:V-type ATP synthase subunit D [Clostridiales bacterium]
MALLNVNPTRMELTRLKKSLATALKGHKLLKDKRDELMRRFLELVRVNMDLRLKVEEKLRRANSAFDAAGSLMRREVLMSALLLPKQKAQLEMGKQNVMSVEIPVYELTMQSKEGDIYSYGYKNTDSDLDTAVKNLADILPDLLKLAEVEKSCELMSVEIEKTRRRVNALEHIMIPNYRDTIKYITMKLDESERSSTTRLMKVRI